LGSGVVGGNDTRQLAPRRESERIWQIEEKGSGIGIYQCECSQEYDSGGGSKQKTNRENVRGKIGRRVLQSGHQEIKYLRLFQMSGSLRFGPGREFGGNGVPPIQRKLEKLVRDLWI
jgi:hypothetical protein